MRLYRRLERKSDGRGRGWEVKRKRERYKMCVCECVCVCVCEWTREGGIQRERDYLHCTTTCLRNHKFKV